MGSQGRATKISSLVPKVVISGICERCWWPVGLGQEHDLLKPLTQLQGAAEHAHRRLHFKSVVSTLCQIKGLIYPSDNSTEFSQAIRVMNLALNFLHREHYLFLFVLQWISTGTNVHPAPAKLIRTHKWEVCEKSWQEEPDCFHTSTSCQSFSPDILAHVIWQQRVFLQALGLTQLKRQPRLPLPSLEAELCPRQRLVSMAGGRWDSEFTASITNTSMVSVLTRAFTSCEWCLLLSPAQRFSYLIALGASLQFPLLSSVHKSLQISAKNTQSVVPTLALWSISFFLWLVFSGHFRCTLSDLHLSFRPALGTQWTSQYLFLMLLFH